jgi:catechol 2,3-dioxygenase-like lactoylglutathione lyase family enzyme
MAVIGISHVAVGVSDMDRALELYRDIIGLDVTLDTVEDVFGGRRRAVYLRTRPGPHEFFLVLDQQLENAPTNKPLRIMALGTHHFSFWVDNLEEVFERAVAAGFRSIMAPSVGDAAAYGEPAGSGRVLSAFVKDQDGNAVQLDQRL